MNNNTFKEESELSAKVAYVAGPSNTVLAILGAGALVSLAVVVAAIMITSDAEKKESALAPAPEAQSALEAKVLPAAGVTLPINWDDLGPEMAASGVIDSVAFESIYAERGGLGDAKKLLSGTGNGEVVMTQANSGILLNLLWAFGLGNKNEILEKGEMMSPAYNGAGNFASTGGWTLAKGNPMSHYSMHEFVKLDAEGQAKVARVAKNIYRPCCGNSTHFPDCNHGMAMLGLLELMAANGVSEEEMYRVALQVNAYWFPGQYLTIAQFLESNGVTWEKASPKELLGAAYSSGGGYKQVAAALEAAQNPSGAPRQQSGGGSCGV